MKDMLIGRIEDGTVIDHVPAGGSLKIIKILGISEKFPSTVSIAMNVNSKKLGKKDILKVENRELDKREVNKVALVAPCATVNIIRKGRVAGKYVVQLPELLDGVVNCTNPQCITKFRNEFSIGEPVRSKFYVTKRKPLTLRCAYCERNFTGEDLEELV
ncbi:MAG: aspartate carbamoyltransferase regulatory subunit [archaeon]